MYNLKTQGGRPAGRSKPRSGAPRPSYNHRGGRPQGGRKFVRKSTADVSRFVKKSTVSAEVKMPEIKHLFTDFKFGKDLENNILKKGYKSPTHIQDQAIPFIMQGHDVVGLANTGTGKTGAFLLPLIEKVSKDRTQNVLILAPTRELALQIEKEFRGFAVNMKMFSAICVGGMPIYAQINELMRRPNFVIGTPGRIKDLADRGKIRFGNFNNIVLDEVDHMLDMGFVEPITEILKQLATKRQSLFFSATMPSNIRGLIQKFTRDPKTVEIASRNHVTSVDQDIVKYTDEAHKFSELKRILGEAGSDKVLIFIETKRQVDKLAKALSLDGFPTESIHGDKRQNQRRKALSLFDENKVKILVATDVAARGLDIKGITHVINYTLPQTNEDYTHRIGRTGRGTQTGKALTFVN